MDGRLSLGGTCLKGKKRKEQERVGGGKKKDKKYISSHIWNMHVLCVYDMRAEGRGRDRQGRAWMG